MEIFSVRDEKFRRYGKVWDNIESTKLVKGMEHTPLPEDVIAYDSAAAAAKNLPEVCDKFRDGENFEWQELSGAHDFNIWYLGFYNFAQIAFQEH